MLDAAPKTAFSRSIFQDWPLSYPNLFRYLHADDEVSGHLVQKLHDAGIHDIDQAGHPVLTFLDNLAASSRQFQLPIRIKKKQFKPFSELLEASFSSQKSPFNGKRSNLIVNLALANLKQKNLIHDFIYTDSPLREHFADLNYAKEILNNFDSLGVDFLLEIKPGYFFPLQVKSESSSNNQMIELTILLNSGENLKRLIPDIPLTFNDENQTIRTFVKRNINTEAKLSQRNLKEVEASLLETLEGFEFDESKLLYFPEGIKDLALEDLLLEMYQKDYIEFYEPEPDSSLLDAQELKRLALVRSKQNKPKLDLKEELGKAIRSEEANYPELQKVLKEFIARNPLNTKEAMELMSEYIEFLFSNQGVGSKKIKKLENENLEKLDPKNQLEALTRDNFVSLKLDIVFAILKDRGYLINLVKNQDQSLKEALQDSETISYLIKTAKEPNFYRPIKLGRQQSQNFNLTGAKRARVAKLHSLSGLVKSPQKTVRKGYQLGFKEVRSLSIKGLCKLIAKLGNS